MENEEKMALLLGRITEDLEREMREEWMSVAIVEEVMYEVHGGRGQKNWFVADSYHAHTHGAPNGLNHSTIIPGSIRNT